MAVSKLNPAAAGIPFGDDAGRPSSPDTGQPYFNGESGRLEIYTTNGWNNIVQETPGVASITGHYYESDGQGEFVVSGTNFVDGAIAYAVGTNGIQYEATTTTYNSLVQLTVLFENLSSSYEPYDVKIVNPSNLFGLLPDAFIINEPPVWSTTAGSLGSYGAGSVSIQVSATDDESDSLTYAIVSGSLPSGLSMSSAGLISGTMTAAANIYTFTVSATDSKNTAATRIFSITSTGPTVTGGTLTSDSTYYYRTFTGNGSLQVSGTSLPADILTIAGGGGGGSGYYAGGAGAGGVLYSSSSTIPVATHSIVIGAGGNGSTYTTTTGSNGTNSTFGSLTTAIGGGGAGSRDSRSGKTGNDGGSGGGCAFPGTSGGLGTSGQGNNGGSCGSGYGASGGGAGAVGNDGPGSPYGSNGGIGTNSYSSWASATSTGASGYYGGGGAAGSDSSTTRAGGLGGGGAASNSTSQAAGNGSSYTGGGGGGGSAVEQSGGTSASGTYQRGGNGGSGLVIVRYAKSAVGD